MWMPAQTTVPPLATARSAGGTRGPTGAKISAASSGSGGAASRAAGPDRAEAARERRRRRVAGAGEGVDRAPLVERHLRDDVGGGAEPVKAEPLGVAGRPQRAIADEAGAEERRRLDVRVASAGSAKQKR